MPKLIPQLLRPALSHSPLIEWLARNHPHAETSTQHEPLLLLHFQRPPGSLDRVQLSELTFHPIERVAGHTRGRTLPAREPRRRTKDIVLKFQAT